MLWPFVRSVRPSHPVARVGHIGGADCRVICWLFWLYFFCVVVVVLRFLVAIENFAAFDVVVSEHETRYICSWCLISTMTSVTANDVTSLVTATLDRREVQPEAYEVGRVVKGEEYTVQLSL